MFLSINKLKQSFSLIEVLVFTSIMSVFLVIAASVVTVSLRNMKVNEHKISASHYARQLEEWLRAQKEINWGGTPCSLGCPGTTAFTELVTRSNTYCFNSAPISLWGTMGTCVPPYGLNSLFRREVVFSPSGGAYISRVDTTITVYWEDLGREHKVETKTVFSVLE